ncbi:hypothetical protein B296_00035319 [Ensete ventricosum]|uniref:Uncharacterized protein n=1 Tax=Ensete ventricosum TaxID=4639 RepID=A0A427A5X9_ENSVE|nr:hypothetical protein B296_00035319 [Ensete ventricosum]
MLYFKTLHWFPYSQCMNLWSLIVHKFLADKEDLVLNQFPAIFLMDCTLNDCGLFLKPLGKKENYPILLLFPAENKSAITYEGDMSVVSIMEFLESHGGNSHYHKHEGIFILNCFEYYSNTTQT